MINQEFLYRRQALLAKMQPASATLIFAAPEVRRNADNTYPYRQDSYFWYFTGFNEPQALLVLIKRSNGQSHTVLFNRERNKTAEIWHGRRLGQQGAVQELAVDEALAFTQIKDKLPVLLAGLQILYHNEKIWDFADQIIDDLLPSLSSKPEAVSVISWQPWANEMRLIKSPVEIDLLRKAGEISAKAHIRAMRECRAGMFEYQLEAAILHEFHCAGARAPSYNTIVGSGANSCILHYTENQSQLCNGDLVLIDAGCEYQCYAGDITRTFPVNGKFTPAQRQIYDIVLEAQETALRLFAPGISIQAVMQQVVRVMVAGLVKIGILQGDVDSLTEQRAYTPFFMHGLSHWLGLDVHDVGDYGENRSRSLLPGMVLTVEPGLYIAPDADVPAAYRGIGVRIEDDILITHQGNENLTAAALKDPDEIEALMAAVR